MFSLSGILTFYPYAKYHSEWGQTVFYSGIYITQYKQKGMDSAITAAAAYYHFQVYVYFL